MKDNQYFKQLCTNSRYYRKIFIFIANYFITMAKSLEIEKDSSPHPPPPPQCHHHLPRLAEATAGPEDVILVLVTAPVLIGRGSSASAVLREGGGGVDLVGKEKKSGLEDIVALFPRKRLFCFSTLFSEDP